MCERDEKRKDFGLWLDYHKHLFDRVKLQEEVRDRWFRYYLLIIAAAVAIVSLILRIPDNGKMTVTVIHMPYFGLFVGSVGCFFFCIHLSQRYNYMRFLKKMDYLEETIFYELLPKDGKQVMLNPICKKNPVGGADFIAHLFFATTNSLILFVSSFAFFSQKLEQWAFFWILATILALVVFIGHFVLRKKVENAIESSALTPNDLSNKRLHNDRSESRGL